MESRIKTFKLITWVLLAIVAMDLVYLQVIHGSYYYRLSTNNRIRVMPVEGKRGRILDRHGMALAENRISFDAMVIPEELKESDKIFKFLSQVLGIEQRVLLQRFSQGTYAPFAPVVVAQDISREQAFILEENKFRFPSLHIQENYRRLYPLNEVGGHVLGYVGKINRSKIEQLKDYGYSAQSIVGYSGVEEYYDQYLQGREGGLQLEVNNRGQQVRLLGIRQAASGQDIQLTIDGQIQQIAHASLEGKRGAVVVMDMETGEILGMISSPSFDPNIFVDSHLTEKIAPLFADPTAPNLNRVIQGLYPPGSVFKIPVALGALETQQLTASTSFLCQGAFRLGRRQIRCAHTHGTLDLYGGIARSCNVYFINTGLKLESDLIAKYAKIVGLGQKTQIDLPFEEMGFIPSQSQRRLSRHQPWYKGDTANLSIGQGEVLVTPIQLMRMMALIGRNGKDIHPFVLKAIDHREVKLDFSSHRLSLSPETIQIVQQGMRQAVTDPQGTARILDIPGLTTSGKTGTAETSGQRLHHAWFAGYTISDKKKIAFCIFLEHGGSSYYACQVAKNLLVRMQKANIF